MTSGERFSDLRVLRWADRIGAALADPSLGSARDDLARVGPIRCNLDLTNLCSHHCYFCEPAEYRAETVRDEKHTLDTERAFEVLEDLKSLDCKTVNFSGGGEPTLHPDFGWILTRAAAMGFRTWVVTHGGLMHKWFAEIHRADHVRVSLDASNEEEHQQMHRAKPGEFGRVIENIRTLVRERASRSNPEVGIAYILTNANSEEESLRRVLEFAEDAGVDFVHFRPISEEEGGGSFTQSWVFLSEQIERLAGEYPSVNVYPLGKRLRDVFTQREFSKCYAAYTLAVVGANGDVQACCDRRDIVFGNVYEKRFKNIWLSEAHRERADKIVPQFCQRCLMCGTNRAIERYVVRNEALAELL